ncbi:hypothetical protein LR948_18140 [Roseivivax sp. GX 12232]|uniref:hypothetical protein n=1 Tax=Roseivivax sp. GX 12232 TaxID=2900547 RepID=UPI001E5D101F|nr:hypothetical protein [Roseivivax sp. GX 12232]MCE0507289.1 hypothetical protein [Roseivivax sp. GX 12232]
MIVEKPLDYGAIGLPRPNPDDPRLALMRPFPKFVEDAVYLLGVIIDPCVLRGGMEDDYLVVSSIDTHPLLETRTVLEMVGLLEALNQTVHYHGFEGTITVEIPVRLSVLLEMMARGELVIDHGSHLRVRHEGDPWKDHDLDRDIARQP